MRWDKNLKNFKRLREVYGSRQHNNVLFFVGLWLKLKRENFYIQEIRILKFKYFTLCVITVKFSKLVSIIKWHH